jgi:hypothetical protein
MPDFLILMHADETDPGPQSWDAYLNKLSGLGVLRGGSAMGSGKCVRRHGPIPPVSAHLAGFIRVEADSIAHVESLLGGNPTYEAGGTIEIRELPKD